MKTKLLTAWFCFASCALPFVNSASAQCAGPMAYTIPIVAGFNLIANQLNCGGNTLPEIIPAPPDGTFVAVFNNAIKAYMVATYDAAFGGWDNPLTLNPGQGAFLNSPVAFNLTLSGTPNVPVLPVPLPPGACCLLSRQTNAPGTYDNIVGAPPTDGTALYMWDAATQSYMTFTYDLGVWDPAIPVATVGESVFICTPAVVIPLCGTTRKWSQRPGYLVFTNNPTMRGGDRPSDVDWKTLMENPNIIVEPNWVIADDFRSDGRPIVTLRWWGSYLSNAPVEFEDGFAVSFFSDVPAAENQFGPFSRPGVLLGTYVAPREAVRRRNTLQIGWDLLPIYQYEVNLKDTCLDHAVTNIAHPEAFLERSNTVYWVAITAEVGHRVVPVRNTNGVIIDWVQQPTNKHTTNHYWGWHTAPTNRLDISVMGHLLMPGMNWLYPSNLWRPNQPFHMELDQAFELLTTNAPPPCETNAPMITNFNFSCDTLKLTLSFNEALDPASATNPANYNAGGVPISIVLLDPSTVVVTFTPPPCPSFFGICISNIKDLCGNVMSPGLCIDFFCPCPDRPKVAKWSQLPGYLTFTNNPNMLGGDRWSDVDWRTLMNAGSNIVQPNWIIAEDFRSDGRPILCVRWWGSYAPGFEPTATGTHFEDAFVLSFFNDVRPASGVFSRPGSLLGTYVAPLSAVKVTRTPYIGWDSNRIFQYEVALEDTCLDHAVTPIARPHAFLEQSNTVYWLAINAEVGHRVIAVTNAAGTIIDWLQQQTEKRATNHFWGWHTSPTQREDVSVMGHLIMPGANWIYPTNLWMPNQVFHMELDQAFELLTDCDTNRPTVLSVRCEDLDTIVVTFSEPMAPGPANMAGNYFLINLSGGPGASVLSALLSANGLTATLQTTPLACGDIYALAISTNLTDLCGNHLPQTIDGYWFMCPCPPNNKVAKWSQLPGYRVFPNPDMHGGDRPSDFDWGRMMQMPGTATNVPVIDAIFDPNLWPPGVPVATNVTVSIAPSYAQTFVAHVPGRFEHGDLPICRGRANAPDVMVELRTTVNGVPGTTAASLLASVLVLATDIPDQEQWARGPQSIGIDWRPFAIEAVPGQAYAVVVRTIPQTPDSYTWLGRLGDPYPEGGAYSRPNPSGPWVPNDALDLGFCTIVATPQPATNHVIPPNWVIADDFRSDGRPILCVRWWGSYLKEPATNRVEDGFVLSFFSDIPAGPVFPYSQPGRLLATYVVPFESVHATNTHWRGWDGHEIWCYEVDLRETCLAHSNTPIATATGFLERSNTIYWLAIDAEIGHRIHPLTNHQGVVTNWLQQPTGRCACDYKHFWGWHTSPTNWNDASVMGNLFMHGKEWSYRKWMPNHFFHMELDQAFELLTATNLPCEMIPPSIVSSSADCDSNLVFVTYSEPMDPTTTEDPVNYILSGGAVVLNVMLDASGTVATLEISSLACGTTNTLIVSNVTDLCKNLLPTTTLTFVCRPCPPAKVAKWSQPPGFRVFTNNPNMHGANRWSDFDWQLLMNSGSNIIEPNWVIAEDFRSDGRPILCVRWWGSYAPGFEPFPREELFFEDGFVLSFFDDFRPPTTFSRPRRLLGSYVAPREAVRITPTPFRGWDEHRIWQYEVALEDTCLDHAFQGIARPGAFLEKSNRVYWLAITAEVGHRIIPVRNTNGVTIDWLQEPTGKRATNHFWGWHTSPIQREDVSVMGHVIMPGTNWVYPFNLWQTNLVLHMEIDQSFELLTGPVVCPAPTSLTIVRTAAGVTISWAGGGFTLQCTPALAIPIEDTVWTDIATTSPVSQPVGPGQARFYRLICP